MRILDTTRLLPSLALALAVSAAASCGGGEEQIPTPTPSPPPAEATPTPEAQFEEGSVGLSEAELARLRGAVGTLGTADPFHFALTATIRAAVAGITLDIPVTAEGDFSPPDASRTSLTLDMGFVLTEFDTVSAGGEAYVTDPQSGDWLQSPGGAAGLLSSPAGLIRLIAGAADQLEPAGRGTIGGTQAVVLRADAALGVLGEGPDETAAVEVWVSEGELRPLRLSIEGQISLSDLGGQFHSQIGDGPGSLSAEIGLSAFGEPVAIEVPEVRTVLIDGRLPGEKKFEQINLTIDFGESHPDYNSVPATSGWHYGPPHAPARWGVHDQFIPDEILLQNLSQGGVGLHYDCPEGCPEIVAAFKEIAGRYPKIVVSPYEGMDARIALTAWTYIDVMDELDPERVDIFVRAHHGSERAPEHFKP